MADDDAAVVGGGDVEIENTHERKENLSNSLVEKETVQGVQKDGDVQKNREREERLRLARERQKEDQRRKMEELREAMMKAEEYRKKQEEERRRKIEEIKKREEEHRATVEERRKRLLDEENERKQAILRKTADREVKLEQAKSKKMCNSVLHPLGCGKSYQSDGTLSSTGRSPSHHRPHSMAGRLPNYTSDTISSQLRIGRSKEKQNVSSCAVVCSRFRSVSPTKNGRARSTGSARKSRSDVQKALDQLATPSKPSVESGATVRHVQNDKTAAPAANSARRARSVSSRPSKLLASPVSVPVTMATLPRGAKSSPAKPTAPTSAKSSKSTTPLGTAAPSSKGAMPSPPKAITPRSLPKEPKSIKEVTSNKPITISKVKAVHNQVDRDQTVDKNKQTPDVSSEVTETKEAKLIEQADIIAAPNEDISPPEKADVMKKSVTEEDEYKQKLAEKRRLAREKAEREAEEERQRIERERLEEEERIRREEEEERRREEEELRLTEEAARLEAERFQKAVEEEERRRRDEEERLEAEKKEKLEAELRAQEEAERKEKERAEKAKREEVERLERKKRLEMIMKRVKTDETSPAKPDTPAIPVVKPVPETGAVEPPVDAEKVEPASAEPSVVAQPSTAAPVVSSPSEVTSTPLEVPSTSVVSPSPVEPADPVDKGTSQFRSPLLRQMLGNKLKAKQDLTSEVSPKETIKEDADSKAKVSDSETPTEQLQDFSSDVKQAEVASDSKLDPIEQVVVPTEAVSEDLADVESLKNANDIEAEPESLLVTGHNGEDDVISSADILISTDGEQLEEEALTSEEAKIITDTEFREKEVGKIGETMVTESGVSSEGSNNGANVIKDSESEGEKVGIIVDTTVGQSDLLLESPDDDAILLNTVEEKSVEKDVNILETAKTQSMDLLETDEPHEASGFLLSPGEMNATGTLPSGIGASNGDDNHGVIFSHDTLIDLSLPDMSSGSSLAVGSLNDQETGASSPLHLLSENSIDRGNLLDLRDDNGVDQLIELSSSDAVAPDRQPWNQSGFPLSAELIGQSTPSPVGDPLVAFEDNSNIQLKSINDVIL